MGRYSPLKDYFKLDTSKPITEKDLAKDMKWSRTIVDELSDFTKTDYDNLSRSIERLNGKTQSVKTINTSRLYVCKECNCFLFNHDKCISCGTPADPKPEEKVQLGCSQCTGSNSGTGRCIFCNPIKTT